MHFSYRNGFYRAWRIAGPLHNLLGIELGRSTDGISIISLSTQGHCSKPLNQRDVIDQVMDGVKDANAQFRVSYDVKRIEYCADDSDSPDIYRTLAFAIIERLATNQAFE